MGKQHLSKKEESKQDWNIRTLLYVVLPKL